MKIIYEPKGKALEYAPLAANLYTGCPHRCRYCYGPTIPNPAKKGLTMAQWREQWHSRTLPRKNMLAMFDFDCWRMYRNGDTRPVLLCFACDPYPPDEPAYAWEDSAGNAHRDGLTRMALQIMAATNVTPIILTKGGTRACRDFDILKAAGGWFGQTMTLWARLRMKWEPNASPMTDRADAFVRAERMGIKTWASVEPVIDPYSACDQIKWLTGSFPVRDVQVSHIKLGKLSGYDAETRAIERSIDWPAYLAKARRILCGAGYTEISEPGVFRVGTYYVKRELREAAWTGGTENGQ